MVFVPQDLGFHPLELPDGGGFIIVVKSLTAPAPFSICRVTLAPLLASLGVVVLPRGSSKGTLNLRMGGAGVRRLHHKPAHKSTSISLGKTVVPSGLPPKLPLTARFMMR